MRLRITPRDESFYGLFTEAAQNLVAAADVLRDLMDESVDREALASKLRDHEHAGDTTTHQVFRQLNSSFVTPFDRDDIYALAANLDDVMDAMEAAGDFVQLSCIEQVPQEMIRQVELLQRAARTTAEAMPRLKAMEHLEPYWIEVNRIENEADKVYRRLLSRLFSGEYEALTVMKLKEVADQLEDAADALEHVAHVVEAITLKES